MRLNKDRFFKDFNNDYLLFVNDFYINRSISYIKKDIKKQYDVLQKKSGLKKILTRNIDYWLIRGWSFEESILRTQNIKSNWKKPVNNSILSLKYWTSRGYDEKESINKISDMQKQRSIKGIEKRINNENYKSRLSPFMDEYWINKGIIDKDEIKIKINSQRKNNINYWIKKGFSEEESKNKVLDFQKEASMKYYQKWNNKKDTIDFKIQKDTHLEYYINKGYSLEDSENMLRERQKTFTLEKCINKYGLEEGTKRYNKRQKDWIKKMFNENTCMATGRSMVADKFIDELIKEINNKNITNQFLYGKNERFIYDNVEKKGKKYDLCYDKKIIEFYGDFWHSNPKIFEANDVHKIKKIKCSKIWQFDKRKIESAKEHNYEVLVIWESEYINSKVEILKKCKKFLINED